MEKKSLRHLLLQLSTSIADFISFAIQPCICDKFSRTTTMSCAFSICSEIRSHNLPSNIASSSLLIIVYRI